MTARPDTSLEPPPGLSRMRGLARAVLAFERIWPKAAPSLGLALLAISAALLDLPRLLPPTLHVAALVITGLAVLVSLGLGVRRVRLPKDSEADRRLELDSGLRHQPLAVLTDAPIARPDPLWAAHVAWARAQIARLRLRPPRAVLAVADPRALRALVLLSFVISLGVAGADARLRLQRALHPAFAPVAQAAAPVLQAWITPPAHTGLPPIFLRAEGGPVTAAVGSRFQASLSGVSGDVVLRLGATTTPFTALDSSSFEVTADLAGADGRLAITRHGREFAGWDLTLIPDSAPILRFPDAPGIIRGKLPQTRIPWEATHPYGVAALLAELHLRDRAAAPALKLPIPLSAPVPNTAPKLYHGARSLDLTAHPWAGLPVTVQLIGRDATGREGRSETVGLTLPQRRFEHPVARALAELRRGLSRDPTGRVSVVAELDRLADLPVIWEGNFGLYLNLRGIRSLLRVNRDAAAVDEAQGRMWSLALALEEGAADRAARRLEEARQALRDEIEALRREAEQRAAGKTQDQAQDQAQDQQRDQSREPPSGPRPDTAELERKTREFQEALDRRLEALAEQARRDPGSDGYDPLAHPLDTRDMQRLAQQMRDAAKAGDAKTEAEKLAELDKMLEALKSGRPERGQLAERERQRAEKRERGQQQVTAVQDVIRREGGILDHAQSRGQSSVLTRRSPRPEDQTQRDADQARQLALRRVLGELMQQFGDLTGDVPPNLGEADTAMRDAAQALAQAQDPQAARAAQTAIEALQKGAQAMRQQVSRQFGQDQGEDEGEGEEGMEAQGSGEGQGEGQGDGQGNGRGDGPGAGPRDGRGGSRLGNLPGQGPGRQGTRSLRSSQHRDPLGRPTGNGIGGLDEASDVQVPDQMEQARTRALQDELRRRGADRTRAPVELDYIDRLLKAF